MDVLKEYERGLKFLATFGIKNFALVFVQFISETSVQGEYYGIFTV